jgi:hypothetical protein
MRKPIGPYVAGEIPEPIVVTFRVRTAAGGIGEAINLTGYEARWVMSRNGGDAVELDADVLDQDINRGATVYVWAADDLAVAGWYTAEMWVGNGNNRLASQQFVFPVRAALATPDL